MTAAAYTASNQPSFALLMRAVGVCVLVKIPLLTKTFATFLCAPSLKARYDRSMSFKICPYKHPHQTTCWALKSQPQETISTPFLELELIYSMRHSNMMLMASQQTSSSLLHGSMSQPSFLAGGAAAAPQPFSARSQQQQGGLLSRGSSPLMGSQMQSFSQVRVSSWFGGL